MSIRLLTRTMTIVLLTSANTYGCGEGHRYDKTNSCDMCENCAVHIIIKRITLKLRTHVVRDIGPKYVDLTETCREIGQ